MFFDYSSPMTRARKTLVDPETTSYYHCIGRCVRRAWLWGEDRVSGRNYEHRKAWVTARLAELAAVFTLDVCAYAVMSVSGPGAATNLKIT